MRIRVLVVDDSPTYRALVSAILRRDERFEVVATAGDGAAAVEAVLRHRPDLVTMDVEMPGLSGLEATAEIMRRRPTPVVILSGLGGDPRAALEATARGALAIVEKPKELCSTSDGRAREALLEILAKAAAGNPTEARLAPVNATSRALPLPPARLVDLIAVGASAGGPGVVAELIAGLPEDAPPVLVVQHIIASFSQGYAEWLAEKTRRNVVLGREDLALARGLVAIAPPERHMLLGDDGRTLRFDAGPPVSFFRPSASVLFRSVGEALGPRGACIVLSGMGGDGAEGALAASRRGAAILVQDPATAAVGSMPRAAIRTGLPARVAPISGLIGMLQALCAPEGPPSRARASL